jgi:signal transduction histidine kinase
VEPGFLQDVIINFTIIATLLLLYSFIPERFRKPNTLTFPLAVGIIFGLAAALSIPSLWMTTDSAALGFNVILVPLAGFIAGPVSAAFVAVVLLAGSGISNGSLSSLDILTVTSGILLGALVYQGKSLLWFPKSYTTRLVILGAGVVAIEACSSLIQFYFIEVPGGGMPGAPGGAPPGGPPLFAIIPFIAFSFIVTIALGGITGFIDRKRQAERELRRHKDHLEALVNERTAELRMANSLQKATFDATADGIVVVDHDNRIRASNEKAARILGLPRDLPEEPADTALLIERLQPVLVDPAGLVSAIDALPESAEQVVTSGLRFRDGRICEIYVQPEKIGTRIVGRVFSIRDITEQRHAEDAIRAANNKLLLLSDLTRHDILNQLTALSAYLELVREKAATGTAAAHLDTMAKILEVIHLQVEFTRDYQNLGIQKPSWERVAAEFAKAAEAFSDQNIRFVCETGELEIYADPMIGRVFHNFIDNSVRHGEHVTEARLFVQRDGSDLLLVYEDNGAGIAPGDKEKIFEKGYGKHTGLGMFLIREILSITGLAITENGWYGKGARFEIRVTPGNFRNAP